MTAFRVPRVGPTPAPRRGLTLVEMLVAMALTLVLMGAVAQLFGMLGQGINGSRSVAELNDRMRATAYRLRQDLTGITVDLSDTPPIRSTLNSGYLEIIEGRESDSVTYLSGQPFNKCGGTPEPYLTSVGSDDRLVGDIDDVILMTTKSPGEMFSGRLDTRNNGLEGGGLRSPFAEVVWFCRPTLNTTNPRTYTLYRRQRLVMAHPGAEPFVKTTAAGQAANSFGGPPNTLPFTSWADIFALTDVSCRRQGSVVVPNTLGDLSRRENRFMHGATFPHVFPLPMYADDADLQNLTLDSNVNRMGEDVILTNVIAFDVRVWDSGASLQSVPALLTTGTYRNQTELALGPGDPGYGGGTAIPTGAHVDLNWTGAASTTAASFAASLGSQPFSGYGKRVRNSTTNYALPFPTYDSWTDFYEVNGLDDDGDSLIDQGTDGMDNNGNGVIDESAEQETSPPYPVPLHGIQVRIRCYEPSSRQVRQITVTQAY